MLCLKPSIVRPLLAGVIALQIRGGKLVALQIKPGAEQIGAGGASGRAGPLQIKAGALQIKAGGASGRAGPLQIGPEELLGGRVPSKKTGVDELGGARRGLETTGMDERRRRGGRAWWREEG
jgi:hypothetical protein